MIELSDRDYARAEQMLAPHRARRVPTVQPQWLPGGNRFWYQVGGCFVVVDPAGGGRRDAFDHDRLATALSVAAGTAVEAADLPISALDLDVAGGLVRFSAFGTRWEFSDRSGTCTRVDDEQPGPGEIPSPDGRWLAFRRDGNVHVRSREEGDEFALTHDAEPGHDYGSLPDAMSGRMMLRQLGIDEPAPVLTWSPDSTRLLVHRLDQRGLPEQVLVESAPRDGGRPVEHRLRYPMPGDDAQPTMAWYVLDVTTRTAVRQQDDPFTVVHPTAVISARWRGDKGDAVHFLQASRDARTLELRRLDPATGATNTVLRETGKTRVDPTPELGDPTMTRVLDSGEVLWWSQRDGWGHLYLHAPEGGKVVQVTTGQWLVRSLLWVDQQRRQVWFVATGLVDDDPYVRQVCRVDLDGTGFTRLTDDDLDHDAVSPPEGGYLVDRASTVSRPPRTSVLDGHGQVLVELEATSTDELEALGWTPPERFRAVAADGKTPIHGLLWRPHGFDPQGHYPVIDSIYPGPQTHRAGPAFDTVMPGEAESLAALGFAVVAIDGRGTAGRSKAFADHSYGDLGNAGALDDHITAIRQLSHLHPWLDTGRVGITGHSAGGYAAARAVLAHPDFYSVGVARAGNHDNSVNHTMWAEHYHGDVSADGLRSISNIALASSAGLRGKLFLIHGELDDNALPAGSMRLVDALIEADADVDMLIVPGAHHGFWGRGHYLVRQTWNYFVRHLHGTEPPAHRLAPLPLPAL